MELMRFALGLSSLVKETILRRSPKRKEGKR